MIEGGAICDFIIQVNKPFNLTCVYLTLCVCLCALQLHFLSATLILV